MRAVTILCLVALAGCQEEFADWPEPETAESALGAGFTAAFRADPGGAPRDLAAAELVLLPAAEPVALD